MPSTRTPKLSRISTSHHLAPHFVPTPDEIALILAYRQLDDDSQNWIGDLTDSLLDDGEFRRHKKPSLRLIGGAV